MLGTKPAFASISEPPLQNISDYNVNLSDSGSLDNYFDPSRSFQTNLSFFLGTVRMNLTESAFLDMAGPSMVVDDSAYPVPGFSLLIVSGSNMSHLATPREDGGPFVCDKRHCDPVNDYCILYCDYDSDDCAEYENSSGFSYELDIAFNFRNISQIVHTNTSSVVVPSKIMEAMQDSSGEETLNVSVTGLALFNYVINDRHIGFGDICYDDFMNASANYSISLNATYRIAGRRRTFFLVSPILREQWFRNNHFDLVVLSQAPLYHEEVLLNGNTTRNLTLRSFDIVTDPYGLERIVSNVTYPSCYPNYTANLSRNPQTQPECSYFLERRNLSSPYLLEPDNFSYSYIYMFNSTYAGLGMNGLALKVVDVFGKTSYYRENITSRMLSVNNATMENGSPIDPAISWKSEAYVYGSLSPLQISLGLLALLLIVVFLNSWLLDKEIV